MPESGERKGKRKLASARKKQHKRLAKAAGTKREGSRGGATQAHGIGKLRG